MSDLLNYILNHEESFRRARLPSLYSDFSLQRHTNPDGYASNVSAWQHALANAARAGHIPSSLLGGGSAGQSNKQGTGHKNSLLVLTTSDGLVRELESPEWGRPVALGCVVDEAIRTKTMIPLQTYLTSPDNIFRKRWVELPALTPSNVVNWSFRQLKGFMGSEDETNIGASAKLDVRNLVLVDNVKEAAKLVLNRVSASNTSSVDRIYSKEMFCAEFTHVFDENTTLSETDFDVLLTFLSRDKDAIIYDGKTIKFKDASDNSTSITQQDVTIASLKALISSLTIQVESLEHKIKEQSLAAQNAVNNKNRISALSALRSKKLAERNLKQRTDTLAQVEEVYSKIEQAADQVEIVKVMEASTGVLRGLHAQVGGVERVEDVVEELREEMSKVDEVGNVISEAGPVVDEGEIDDELEAMESQDREEREKKEAQETQRRLVELEKIEEAGRAAAQKERQSELDIDESINRLSQMSIDDSGNGADKAKPTQNMRTLSEEKAV
ncbi:hypothetical protein FQN54_007965 [Arachnomyces sp. PD_36]|nr:hypothetical protein FQN54_007965 [Arachnomyces sp. PD_36]